MYYVGHAVPPSQEIRYPLWLSPVYYLHNTKSIENYIPSIIRLEAIKDNGKGKNAR